MILFVMIMLVIIPKMIRVSMKKRDYYFLTGVTLQYMFQQVSLEN